MRSFVITGFSELGPGRLEVIHVAENEVASWPPRGQGTFGLARTRLWEALDWRRDGPSTRKGFAPVRPELVAEVKFFGRYPAGWIRDGVLLNICPVRRSD